MAFARTFTKSRLLAKEKLYRKLLLMKTSLSFLLFILPALLHSEPLKIGALLHITGDYAAQGEAFRQGIEMAAEDINAHDGIVGAPIELIFEDTQYLSVRAASGAQKLISQDKVSAALISTLTEAKVASPLFERAKVSNIVLWDSAPDLENIGDYTFGIGPWAPASSQTAAKFGVEKFTAKSAAVISTNAEWSENVAKGFIEAFRALGGKITDQVALNPSETDYRTILAKIKSHGPDILYVPVDSGIVPLFKQIKQLKFTQPVLTSDIITEDYFIQDAAAFEGVYQTMPQIPDSELTKKLKHRFEAKYKKRCTQTLFVAWGYDALTALAKGFAEARRSKTELHKALYALPAFDGASATIKFNTKGSSPAPLAMYQVRDGAFVAAD